VWTIGDALIKGNRDGYRRLYLERKALEAERPEVETKMHAHRRAQRYMEKRLLRDLWREWRRLDGLPHEGQSTIDIHAGGALAAAT
jgi:hypothetical protein